MLWQRRPLLVSDWTTALWWSLLSVAPDFDFLAVVLVGDKHLHRAATHSLLVALVVGFLLAFLEARTGSWKRGLLYSLIIGSHALLDAASTNSHYAGVTLLWPLSSARFAFDLWRQPGFDWHHPPIWPEALGIFIHQSLFELVVFLPLFLLLSFLLAYGQSRRFAASVETN